MPAAPPQRTSLYERHLRLGARMTEFAGWELPLQYAGILAEHAAVRQAAGIFDTGHMGQIAVGGPAAEAFLDRLLTVDVVGQAVGRCRYGLLLREDGGILDDLIVYRLGPERWLVVVNAGTADRDLAWMRGHAPGRGAELTSLRGPRGKIDVQGPASPALLGRVLGGDVSAMAGFACREASCAAGPLLLSRTGYTGETGYEVYAAPEVIGWCWDRLLEAGASPAGLGARDTLRLEAGLPLYGHEMDETVSPVETGLERYASKPRPFVGREALEARRRAPDGPRQTGFVLSGRQSARAGQPVVDASGTPAGRVTSGSFAPSLGYAIGIARVRPDLAAPGAAFGIDTGRGPPLAARAVALPFRPRGRAAAAGGGG